MIYSETLDNLLNLLMADILKLLSVDVPIMHSQLIHVLFELFQNYLLVLINAIEHEERSSTNHFVT